MKGESIAKTNGPQLQSTPLSGPPPRRADFKQPISTRTLPGPNVAAVEVAAGFPVVAGLPACPGMLVVALVAPRHGERRLLLIPSRSEAQGRRRPPRAATPQVRAVRMRSDFRQAASRAQSWQAHPCGTEVISQWP